MVVSVTERCVCGCRDARKRTHHKLRVLECSFCGMQRQIVSDTVDDYVSWYRGTYHSDIYTHTTTQDEDTARKRIKCYDIRPQGRLLDIGCGNGAFVNVALRQGIESYGIDVADVAQDKTRIYVGELESVSFPTCEFDCVTMHDVLEHFPDPLSSLREVMRIVKEEGQLILEVPDFHCSSGKRHWKEREHIWFLRRKDVERMLDQAGFDLQSVTKPVSGKLVFYATKPKQERLNILVPPGIGDIYWVMVKLQSFLRERQITVPPNVHIVSLDSAKDRSADYVRMVPFVRGAGYKQCNRHSSLWKEAYMQDGKTVFLNKEGCEYFIAYNGVTRHGHSIDVVDPQWECNWLFKHFRSLEQVQYGARLQEEIGPYYLGYFINHGMYKRWLLEFNEGMISSTLERIARETGRKIVLIGAKWDENGLNQQLVNLDKTDSIVDLTGKTSLEQAFGVIEGSSGVIGFPSGMTVLATAFRKPTLMFWHDYFHENFFWNACPPQSRGNWYDVVNTKDTCEDEVIDKFALLTDQKRSRRKKVKITRKRKPRRSTCKKKKAAVRRGQGTTKPRPKKQDKVTVTCVLRTGADFTEDYVVKLRNAVHRNLHMRHDFICLTDQPIKGICCVPLQHKWPGWWSKIELFRPNLFEGRVLYFDLDTLIVDGIDEFAEYDHVFTMLAGFRKTWRRASGVMAWHGDYSGVYSELTKNGHISRIEKEAANDRLSFDQVWIHRQVKQIYHLEPTVAQNVVGIASYKNNCVKAGQPPPGTKIVCFHGKPRPHQVKNVQWVTDNWK